MDGKHQVRTVYFGGRDRRHRQVWGKCSCGWRGPKREKVWEVRLDSRAHREGWGEVASQPSGL